MKAFAFYISLFLLLLQGLVQPAHSAVPHRDSPVTQLQFAANTTGTARLVQNIVLENTDGFIIEESEDEEDGRDLAVKYKTTAGIYTLFAYPNATVAPVHGFRSPAGSCKTAARKYILQRARLL